MKDKICFCLVGKSGTGKSTIAAHAALLLNLNILQSYTTRPKRSEDETGHIFVTDNEYSNLTNIVAETTFGKYKYCATKEQIDNADIYIVDKSGIQDIINKYISKGERQIVVIYIKTNFVIRLLRVIKDDGIIRGIRRLKRDRHKFDNIRQYVDYIVTNNRSYADIDNICKKIFQISKYRK